jgi:uncharacterized delta-60 repeat protein
LQPDGRIVVAGRRYEPSGVVVVRYGADGTLDPTFGSGGKVVTSVGDYSGAYAVAIQPDERIVVAGASSDGFTLARYDPDGSLDPSFGVGGIAVVAGGIATALALQPDGKIVAAGDWFEGEGSMFMVARFERGGSLDRSFGSGGRTTVRVGAFGYAEDVALGTDGTIVVAGWASTLVAWGSALARFDPDGSLDPSFGSGGMLLTHMGESSFGRAVAIQPDGKIVVAGGGGTLSGFVVARYEPDGSPDETFGVGGQVLTTFRSGNALRWAEADAVTIQPDGKIVAAGQSADGFALARYLVTSGCVVPDTKGAWVPEARAAVKVAGCSVGSIRRVFSHKLGRGFVLSQSPAAESSLPQGAPVDLVVSKGRKTR